MKRSKILIVGAFRKSPEDDRVAGLSFACRSLVESELKDQFELVLVDSTMKSIRSRSGLHRLPSAAYRVLICFWKMLTNRFHCVVCFSSHGNSFLEKGVITILGRTTRQRVVFFPRSGHLVNQLERSRLRRWFARRVLHSAWRVFCQSQSWCSFYSKLIGTNGGSEADRKFHVVENWLADTQFADGEANVSASNSGGFVVGFYNRLEVAKGIFDYLEAVKAAHAINPNVHGIIYGDGAQSGEVQRIIVNEGLSFIRYGGWLESPEEKREELQALDVMLFCSLAEGFPNALLESIALKIPAIATTVGAVPDIVEDGQSGILVEPGDVSGMANALVNLSRNDSLRRSFAELAYRRAASTNASSVAIPRFQRLLGSASG